MQITFGVLGRWILASTSTSIMWWRQLMARKYFQAMRTWIQEMLRTISNIGSPEELISTLPWVDISIAERQLDDIQTQLDKSLMLAYADPSMPMLMLSQIAAAQAQAQTQYQYNQNSLASQSHAQALAQAQGRVNHLPIRICPFRIWQQDLLPSLTLGSHDRLTLSVRVQVECTCTGPCENAFSPEIFAVYPEASWRRYITME